MKKKIAFIGIKALPANAGVDTVVEKIVGRLDRTRYEPVVYVNRALVAPETAIPGVRLVRIPTISGKYLNATLLFLLSALHALFRGDYDLINVHSVETCFVLPILRLRYKVIVTAHGLARMEPAGLGKWGWAKLGLIIPEVPFMFLSNARTSVSRPDKDFLEKAYHRTVHYLPNGIDELEPDLDGARALLAKHGLEPGQYLLFSAGRVVPRKGCHFVLEAMRGLGDDARLLVVGDMGHVPEYTAQVMALADERTRFAGFIADKALLFGLIALSRLYVFPTTYEAMAITLLEVAALRTPLIASDIPENRVVLPDQAVFFKSADVADLRARIEWAMSHEAEMKDVAARAYQWVAQNYHWPTIIRAYEQLFDELLSPPRRVARPVEHAD